MKEHEEPNIGHGVHGPSFLLGLVGGALVGAVATIAFATYAEERFKAVTNKTKELGSGAHEKLDVVKAKATAGVNSATEAAKATVRKTTAGVKHKVGDIAGDVEKLAKDVRLAVESNSEA